MERGVVLQYTPQIPCYCLKQLNGTIHLVSIQTIPTGSWQGLFVIV
ncbi:MAG: hypothetical protein FWF78_00540 [Defluviitaleaceae bacterium]|nr:hypothetical protein [Defluviitaleaceae bacterium]